ncbi:MAG: zinc-binding dehydrogenase [Alphaproteobacteria bacterium]|nr:zinc-binding dehydrogenase [Alphaproteobacteria bacterium]
MSHPQSGLQLRSLVKKSGELELSLQRTPVPQPKAGQIVVRVEATPINPSDLGLLLGPVDPKSATATGSGDAQVVTAPVAANMLRAMAARLDQSMAAGNEGAGTVIAAGEAAEAQKLIGRTVAMLGGAMYAEYRVLNAADVLVLPEGTTAAEGASCFVNPLTALGMVETMRMEGHKALVHTAAASNLGQMLVKICKADGVKLVNIVRSAEQAKLLTGIGAEHVCNSAAPGFMSDLTEALAATGATIAFDAIGGGRLAGQILTCMEAAASRTATEFNRYGSSVYKQVYIYGGLDMAPTELTRSFGFSWGLGGWLLTPFLQKIGPAGTEKLRQRVLRELKTTFASHYTKVISLADALNLDNLRVYAKRATGEKYLIDPSLGRAG